MPRNCLFLFQIVTKESQLSVIITLMNNTYASQRKYTIPTSNLDVLIMFVIWFIIGDSASYFFDESSLFYIFIQNVFILILFCFSVFFYLHLKYKITAEDIGIRKEPWLPLIFKGITFGILMYIFQILFNLIASNNYWAGISLETKRLTPKYIVGAILMIPPLLSRAFAEELLFRPIFYAHLRKGDGIIFSTIITSSVFAFFHIHRVQDWRLLKYFIGGMIFSLIYERYRSLKLNALIHFVLNFIVIMLSVMNSAHQ